MSLAAQIAPPGSRLRRWSPLVMVTIPMLTLFIVAGWTRLIDGDEGYLLYAARLVSEGRHLYTDFFCPQAPLVPTIFGYVYGVVGAGWYSARVTAALFATGSGLFVFAIARLHSNSARVAGLAAFLFATSGYTIGWLPIAKTYGLAVFFGLAGVWFLESGGKRSCFVGGDLHRACG